jgi:serine/threonine-protein kinase
MTPQESAGGAPTGSSPATNAEGDPLIGQEPLGQYRVLQKLGEGGFGAAYLAEQLGIGRKSVIKVLHRHLLGTNEAVRRFEREAKVLAALDHHHIVRIYNSGVLDDGRLFVAMEYGGDTTLEAEIRRGGPLDADRALRIAEQVCEALQEAHDHGVVHRDLKPANILLGRKGTQDWVKVVDVGIARIVEERDQGAARLTKTGAIIGTPAYFSPEQARGLTVDGRSDLYSMAISLYEMLTGALPVQGVTPMDFVRAHCVDPPTPMSRYGVSLPGYLEDVIWKALEKDPDHRYQSAEEMREALAKARARLHATANSDRVRLARRAWWKPAILAAAVAMAGVAVLLFVLAPASNTSNPTVEVEVAGAGARGAPKPVEPPRESHPPQATAVVAAPPEHLPSGQRPAAPEGQPQPVRREQQARPAPAPARTASAGGSDEQKAAGASSVPAGQDAARLAAEAERLAAAKDVKGAIAKFERVLELQPSRSLRARVLRGLAILHERTGDSQAALKYYLEYRPLAPSSEVEAVDTRIGALRAELELEPGR